MPFSCATICDGGRVDVLADDVDALLDERLGGGALLDRVVPGAGEDHGGGGVRIDLLGAELVGVDRPVDEAERDWRRRSRACRSSTRRRRPCRRDTGVS